MEEGSASGRMKQIKFALEIMKLRPLTGVGLGNFPKGKILLLGMDPEEKITMHVAHNSYLELGAEIGIIGMLLFSYLVVRSIRDCRKIEKWYSGEGGDKTFYCTTRSIRLGLIGFGVTFFFLSEQYNSLLYQWFAIITILDRISRREQGVRNEV